MVVVLGEPDIDLQALLDQAPPVGVHRSRDRATLHNIAALRCRGASWITLAVGLTWVLAMLDPGDAWIGGSITALAVSAAAVGLLELRRVVVLDGTGVRWRNFWRSQRVDWQEITGVDVRQRRRAGPASVWLETRPGRPKPLRALSGSWLQAGDNEPRILAAILAEEAAIVRVRRTLQAGTAPR